MGGRRRLPRSAAVRGASASPPEQSGVGHQGSLTASGNGFELSVPKRSPPLVPLATKAAIAAVQELTESPLGSSAGRKRRGSAWKFLWSVRIAGLLLWSVTPRGSWLPRGEQSRCHIKPNLAGGSQMKLL